MKNNFICPRCKGYLNVGESIILSADTEHKDAGLILLSPELGNYTVKTNTNFQIRDGEKYDFFCPICQQRLSTDIHDNLSRVLMVDNNDNHFEILFSKIAGEKSTYKIIGESLEVFGEHNTNYMDFVNLSSFK
jgi:uncharacterized protein YbaR (Trm112 family)